MSSCWLWLGTNWRGMFGRKEADWISGSQLREKTRSSERAIKFELETLVKKKLIEDHDEKGHTLSYSKDRQGKTRLYYGLHPSVFNPVDNSLKSPLTFTKKRITKETLTKEKLKY